MAHIGLEGNRKEEIQLEGDTQHETVLREFTVVMVTVFYFVLRSSSASTLLHMKK